MVFAGWVYWLEMTSTQLDLRAAGSGCTPPLYRGLGENRRPPGEALNATFSTYSTTGNGLPQIIDQNESHLFVNLFGGIWREFLAPGLGRLAWVVARLGVTGPKGWRSGVSRPRWR